MARRRAWLVAVPLLLASVVALVLSLLSTPLYRASADVLIVADADGVERDVDTEVVVASGSELVAEVRALVGSGPELSVDAVGAADVLQFTATSTNASNAATAANAYADVYVERTPGAEVVDRAAEPSDPYEPDVLRTVLLAALAGLAIGVVAALVVAWRDTTVRSARQLTGVSGVANLAEIPRHPLGEVRPDDVAVLRDPNSIESEAYRTLRTLLDFVASERPFRLLLVTSPRPGEGKSSVAANLAAVVAQSGRKVVLVDGDLRRPQVHRLFVTGNDRGLSSVLTGEASLQECVQRIDLERNVALLSAGPPPSDPAELLTHERLRLTLEALADAADLVVIDAPPVLPVADPIILAQVADATLLVATAGFSDRREWSDTLDRLRKVDALVIGTVLMRPDSRVHASPSYRYAPSAAPAHWWVTEASRRSDSTASPTETSAEGSAETNAADVTTAMPVDLLIDDGAALDDAVEAASPMAPDEMPTTEAYPWRGSADADDLAWLDEGTEKADANGAGDGDDGATDSAESVSDGDAPAG